MAQRKTGAENSVITNDEQLGFWSMMTQIKHVIVLHVRNRKLQTAGVGTMCLTENTSRAGTVFDM